MAFTPGSAALARISSARTPVPKPSVAALIPLSLLEAIRNLDTPVEDGLDELAEEIMVRRLGLSPTVAAQIQRYRQSGARRSGVELDEAVSVFRLVGRRPDAALAFADAGRRAARYAIKGRGRSAGPLLTLSPASVGRRLALRKLARLTESVFGGNLQSSSQDVEISMSTPLSIVALPGGEACPFYGSAYLEMLRALTGFEGALLHVQCRSRGDADCRWHTAVAEVYE
jgi:hypothetical protein